MRVQEYAADAVGHGEQHALRQGHHRQVRARVCLESCADLGRYLRDASLAVSFLSLLIGRVYSTECFGPVAVVFG